MASSCLEAFNNSICCLVFVTLLHVVVDIAALSSQAKVPDARLALSLKQMLIYSLYGSSSKKAVDNLSLFVCLNLGG